MAEFENILIVGCGNMGSAMLKGWLASEIPSSHFTIVDPALEDAPPGVELVHAMPEEPANTALMLGFKPQQLAEIAPGLQAAAGDGVTVLSLLAGVNVDTLEAAFPNASAHVRVMPNLAAAVRKCPVALYQRGLDDTDCVVIRNLFARLGCVTWLHDEAQFDLVTALTGSGPGFVYRFIDALSGAATELGLDEETAQTLAVTMVDGAATLAAESTETPGELADRVASKGGMTREGLDVLDKDKALISLLKEALEATRDRGTTLSAEACKQS